MPNQPTREDLERLYVQEGLTVREICRRLGSTERGTKEALLRYQLWDDQKAARDRRKNIRPPATRYDHVSFESVEEPAQDRIENAGAGEAIYTTGGEAQPSRSEGDELPAITDERGRSEAAGEVLDTAWTRLSPRQQRTAVTFAQCMSQPHKMTWEAIAAECGIAYSTLREDMNDEDFQEVTTEFINRKARWTVNALMKQDLTRLLESGKIGARDRETILKYLGELQPDTMIQIANVMPRGSGNVKLPY
jgi:hypothetical protein